MPSTTFYSTCGNYALMRVDQSGISASSFIRHSSFYKKDIKTGSIKKIEESEFRKLVGNNENDIDVYLKYWK